MRLANKTALVTGAASGFGAEIARTFAREGAKVALFDLNGPGAQAVAREIGTDALAIAGDVTSARDVTAAVAASIERHGRLDVVVNNAGGSPVADTATASPRFSEAIIRLNLLAPLFVAQAAYGVMQDQDEGGSIVNIASVSGLRATPTSAAYGAAKAGLLNLTLTLAVEWAPKVRVNAVTVGMVRTELAHLHYGDEAAVAAVGATVPLGRLAEPVDVADACLFLASPLASYVSGANLLVHGGGELPAYLQAASPED